jgi:hypothetical protein
MMMRTKKLLCLVSGHSLHMSATPFIIAIWRNGIFKPSKERKSEAANAKKDCLAGF